ncbi:MAG: FtsH protease activity modulator HflK [Candidatus Latescibacteria bacterium]|nr:FtsH protease activity modulator HflK [Candidatus Latescibacterota bacterium]
MDFKRRKPVVIGGEEYSVPAISKATVWIGGLIIIGLILIFTSLYQVGADEAGVIRRFGRYVNTTQPGLHLKLPFGIDKVTKVPVRRVQKEEFGFKTARAGVRTEYRRGTLLTESLMLTGDLNSAVVEWIVQYRVKDPVNYLFKLRAVTTTIRDISESVMRQVVGDRSVDEVIILSRREVAQEAKQRLQENLDAYETGIHVVTVELKDVNPPDPVKPAFNEVNEAKQEMEKMVNQAWETYNKAVPRASGEAERTIRRAEGYALDRVNRAKGDANKFLAVWKEYNRSKDVTRRRLYLETLNEVLPKIGRKYIIDSEQKGLVQLLQLEEKGEKK